MASECWEWPTQKTSLSPPPLEDLAKAIAAGLKSNFETSSAIVSQCPDLRLPPYHLAGAGLSGHARIADIGDPSNLTPTPDLSKKYNLLSISQSMEMSPERGFLFGASAGPFHILKQNSELMPNLAYNTAPGRETSKEIHNFTHYAKIRDDNAVLCERVGRDNTSFALMGNLYASDGLSGTALHIKASSRKGTLTLPATIQHALKHAYGEKLISIGGVFVVKKGKCNLHVMPDFPTRPFQGRKDVEGWLRYFDVDAPITCLSVFHSGDDQGLGLRMEHTHCFSVDGGNRGGHYHNDLDETKDEVEYEGWFNVAEVLYRIDPPGGKMQQHL